MPARATRYPERSHWSNRMPFLPLLVSAEFTGEYCVQLQFNVGLTKVVDLRPLLVGPVFEPLKTLSEVRRFFIEAGALGWPCGADLAPEALYAAPDVSHASPERIKVRTGQSPRVRQSVRGS